MVTKSCRQEVVLSVDTSYFLLQCGVLMSFFLPLHFLPHVLLISFYRCRCFFKKRWSDVWTYSSFLTFPLVLFLFSMLSSVHTNIYFKQARRRMLWLSNLSQDLLLILSLDCISFSFYVLILRFCWNFAIVYDSQNYFLACQLVSQFGCQILKYSKCTVAMGWGKLFLPTQLPPTHPSILLTSSYNCIWICLVSVFVCKLYLHEHMCCIAQIHDCANCTWICIYLLD